MELKGKTAIVTGGTSDEDSVKKLVDFAVSL